MIKLVTDSCSDIPQEYVDKYNIYVMPLKVIFDNVTYKEGIDISKEEFYTRIKNGDMPRTSQVTPAEFEEIFKRLTQNNDEVIAVLFAAEFSGTYQSAVMAKNRLGNDRIYVIDSRSVSISHGLVVLYAAKLIEEGYSAGEIIEKIRLYIENRGSILYLDRLDFALRGGRLSKTQATIGTMLNIKPIFKIYDGKVVLIDKYMGRKKALNEMLKIIKNEAEENDVIAIGHTCAEPYLSDVINSIKSFNVKNIIVTMAGAVVGSHGGPGGIVVAYQKKQKK